MIIVVRTSYSIFIELETSQALQTVSLLIVK